MKLPQFLPPSCCTHRMDNWCSSVCARHPPMNVRLAPRTEQDRHLHSRQNPDPPGGAEARRRHPTAWKITVATSGTSPAIAIGTEKPHLYLNGLFYRGYSTFSV